VLCLVLVRSSWGHYIANGIECIEGMLSKVLRSMMKVSPDVRGERPVLIVCSMSDTVFNAATTSFQLDDPALNGLSQVTYSQEYPINAAGLGNIALESILPDAPVMTNNVTTLLCLGIIFFEKTGNAFYQINSAKAMVIVEAY
jgi:hypothetical protein